MITTASLRVHRTRGRKPRAGVRSEVRVTFYVTAQERAELQAVAQEQRQSLAAMIRTAVDELVGDYREKKIFDQRQAGLSPGPVVHALGVIARPHDPNSK